MKVFRSIQRQRKSRRKVKVRVHQTISQRIQKM
jgi:hypothetical protein